MPAEAAPCLQRRPLPQFVNSQREQAVVGQAPLSEADHRLDQIRHTDRLRPDGGHRGADRSFSGRAGSAGIGSGTSIGGTGTSIGSTVIRRDGPGRLLRNGERHPGTGTATSKARGTKVVEAISGMPRSERASSLSIVIEILSLPEREATPDLASFLTCAREAPHVDRTASTPVQRPTT